MKVLINAVTSKMGGFKTLINSFIESIDENDKNEYYFFVYKGSINIENKKNNIRIIESVVGDMNYIKRIFWYNFKLPRIITKNNYDCMINLTNYGPIRPKCYEVLLLHNSKHVSKEMKMSLNLRNRFKLLLEDFILWTSLKGAKKLIVQTNYMKQGIINKFNYPKEKIVIIPNASVGQNKNSVDYELEKLIKEFTGLEKNILVNVTLYAKHKNLELMLKAVKYIKENNLAKIKLLMTIDKDEGEAATELLAKIQEYDISDYVLSVGNINHKNIHQLLDRAKIFIFPSYGESFGMPFVEAMRFGVPIIAADLGFAHDVCEDSAIYFKYNNELELANRIVELVNYDDKRIELSEYSKKRSYLYDGKDVVKKYLNLIKA